MRTLHLAYRVTDLTASLDFYAALGYRQVGRVDLDEGATLTMLKFPGDELVTVELVNRPAEGRVEIGSGFSHIAVKVDNLSATIEALSEKGADGRPDRTPRRTRQSPDLMAHRPRWLPDRVGAMAAGARRRNHSR